MTGNRDLESVTRAIQDRQRIVSSLISPGIGIPYVRLAETWRLLVTRGYAEQESKPASSAKVRLSRLLFAHALP